MWCDPQEASASRGQPPPQLTSSKQPLALAVPLDSGHSVPWISRNTPHSFFLHPSVKSNNTLKKKSHCHSEKREQISSVIYSFSKHGSPPCLGECACCGGRWMDPGLIHPQLTLMMKSKWTHNFTYKAGQMETREMSQSSTEGCCLNRPSEQDTLRVTKSTVETGVGKGPCICKRPLFYCCNTCLHGSVLQGFEVKIAVIPPEWGRLLSFKRSTRSIRMTPK